MTRSLLLRRIILAVDQVEGIFFTALMDQFDTDQNGSLDRVEWMAMLHTLSDASAAAENEADWAAAFDVIDVGEDGKLRTCYRALCVGL